MSTVDSSKYFRNVLISGICGATAVPIQTFTLMWANTLFQEQKKKGGKLTSLAKELYKKGGLKRFYEGVASSLATASLSRFGDTATNFMVLEYFSKDQHLKNFPLFLQSAVTWSIASTWRLCLVPLALTHSVSQNMPDRSFESSKNDRCFRSIMRN